MRNPLLEREASYAAVAARQHGLVTVTQLAAAGVSPAGISRRRRAGSLIKVLPGVYRLASVPRSWHQRPMAVYLWAGETSAIAGTAAAALHKLDGCALPNRITVLTPRSLKSPTRLVVVRRTTKLGERVRQFIDGIAVTSCARTLIDISAEVTEAQLELALEDARRRRLVTPSRLEQELDALPPNQPGCAKLRKILALTTGSRPTDSGLEVKVLRLLRQTGYPEPIRQEVLNDEGEFAGRVDLVYPDRRLIIEVQSHRWHSDRRALDSDSERHNRHNAMGWVLMRATSAMLAGHARRAFLRDLQRAYHRPLPPP